MTLAFTAQQAEALRPLLQVGDALLGRVRFRPFDGDLTRCGEIEIELGSVPEKALPLLRAAVIEARNPKQKKRRAKP